MTARYINISQYMKCMFFFFFFLEPLCLTHRHCLDPPPPVSHSRLIFLAICSMLAIFILFGDPLVLLLSGHDSIIYIAFLSYPFRNTYRNHLNDLF